MALESLNAKTLASIIAKSSDAQEVTWLARVHLFGRGHSPIKAWFGNIGGGRPIGECVETSKQKGQEVVTTVRAGLGQRGVQGSATSRSDKTEKAKFSTYRFKVGMMHHAISYEGATKGMSIIGSEVDKKAGPDLAEWLKNRQFSDVLAELDARKHDRNTLRPNFKGNTGALTSDDVFTMNSITDAREGMLGIGATPLAVRKGPNNEVVENYLVQGTHYLFSDLNRNSQWNEIRALSNNQGAVTSAFAGGKPMWDGCILNEWAVKINDWDATQGNRFIPIAYLGCPIAANPASDGTDTADGDGNPTLSYKYIYGGGNKTAAGNSLVDYFENFHNAPYVGFEGTKIAAITNEEKYVGIRAASGADRGKIRLFAYQVNNGNRLTITRAISSADGSGTSLKYKKLSAAADSDGNDPAEWGVGDWETKYLTQAEMPVGSVIYQVNIRGTALCYGAVIGANMMTAGYGSSDGKGATMGKRTSEEQDYGRVCGIGLESVWGCRANQDTNDMVNGYCWMEAAWLPPGFPRISE